MDLKSGFKILNCFAKAACWQPKFTQCEVGPRFPELGWSDDSEMV